MGCSSLGFKKRFLEGLQEKMGWTRLLDESVIAPRLNPGEGQRGGQGKGSGYKNKKGINKTGERPRMPSNPNKL